MTTMNYKTLALLCAVCASVAGCGGDSGDPDTLAAGQSATIKQGQTLHVPSDTVVDQGSNRVVITGHQNTVHVTAGAVVEVQADASGPADNLVIAN